MATEFNPENFSDEMLVGLAIDTPAGWKSTARHIAFWFEILNFDRSFGFFSVCHFFSYLFI